MPNDFTEAHAEDERLEKASPPLPPPKKRTAKLGCRNCGREILDLETLEITNTTVLVIKNCRETDKIVHLRRWLGSHGLWGVLVIDMRGEQSLELLPEGTMGAAGWERIGAKRKAHGELGT